MIKNQKGFSIIEISAILAVIGLIVLAAILVTHSKNGNDSEKKNVIDSTINGVLASGSPESNIKNRQEKGCYQVNQGPYDNGDAACRQLVDLLYESTQESALTTLTDKQKSIETKLISLGYVKEYGTVPKIAARGAINNDYPSKYNHKTGVYCEITTNFPADNPEIKHAYPESFQNLAAVRLECASLVRAYFY